MKYAVREAAKYPDQADRTKYTAAAKKIRFPYWDWSSNPGIPGVVNQATISVYTPSGTQTIKHVEP